ncbi:hypothetical protein QU926_12645 [Pseudomonas asiatica]|uniref:hypothetical protein n=1 Tax=Pseudomonas asiatica TaxID=2219225 RepID=UPI0025AB0BA6|nr:hypothetical protein [Pseudomonas asiatica]MDM9554500.1 hypothetical protein [Pseudomonas asiatica]
MIKGSQRLQAPKTWVGSEEVNVLQVLGDLLDLVEQMYLQIAGHVHGIGPVPSNASAFAAASTATKALQLKNITA